MATVLFGLCTADPAGVPAQGGRQEPQRFHVVDPLTNRGQGQPSSGHDDKLDKQMSTMSILGQSDSKNPFS